MTKHLYDSNIVLTIEVANGFSWLETYALRKYHPRAIFIDVVSFIWFTYFFWQHNWQFAVSALFFGRILSHISVLEISEVKMSQTVLGKLALLHLNPINASTQLIGIFLLFYGLWTHSVLFIMSGVSVVLLGHMFGWGKVDSRLASENI